MANSINAGTVYVEFAARTGNLNKSLDAARKALGRYTDTLEKAADHTSSLVQRFKPVETQARDMGKAVRDTATALSRMAMASKSAAGALRTGESSSGRTAANLQKMASGYTKIEGAATRAVVAVVRAHQAMEDSARDAVNAQMLSAAGLKAVLKAMGREQRVLIDLTVEETTQRNRLSKAYAGLKARAQGLVNAGLAKMGRDVAASQEKLERSVEGTTQSIKVLDTTLGALRGALDRTAKEGEARWKRWSRAGVTAATSFAGAAYLMRRNLESAAHYIQTAIRHIRRVVEFAVEEFVAFEDTMIRVGAVAKLMGNQTRPVFDALKARARDLAVSTIFSAKEIAEGMQFMAMAGLKASDIYMGVEDVLRLSTAAMMDIGKAADIVTNIMAGFGKTAQELPHAVDVLTETFTNSNTSMEQLGNGFKYAGPIARSAGLSFEETAAALGLLANAGYQGEMGGTALRGILMRLQAPTNAVAKRLEALGIQVKKANGDMKGFADILDEFTRAGADAEDIAKIFAQRAGPGFAILLSQGSDTLREFTEALKESEGRAKALEEAVMNSLGSKLKVAQAQISEVGIVLGEVLEPGIVRVLDKITEWSQALKDNEAQAKVWIAHYAIRVAKIFRQLTEWISATSTVVLFFVDLFGRSMESFGIWGAGTKAVWYGAVAVLRMFMGDVEGTIAAQQKAADAVQEFKDSWNGVETKALVDDLRLGVNGALHGANVLLDEFIAGTEKAQEGFRKTAAEIRDVEDAIADAKLVLQDLSSSQMSISPEAASDQWMAAQERLLQLQERLDELKGGGRQKTEAELRAEKRLADQRAAAAARAAEEAAREAERDRQKAQRRANELADLRSQLNLMKRRSPVAQAFAEYQAERAKILRETEDGEKRKVALQIAAVKYARALQQIGEDNAETEAQRAKAFNETLDAYLEEYKARQLNYSALQTELDLLGEKDELRRADLEFAQRMYEIEQNVTDAKERQLLQQIAQKELALATADAAEREAAARRRMIAANIAQGFSGATSGFQGISGATAQEQDKALQLQQLQQQVALATTLEEKLKAQNALYMHQRQISVETADAQIEAFSKVASALSEVATQLGEVDLKNLKSAQSTQGVIGAMQGMISVGAAVADAFAANARQSLKIQAVINAVMAAAAIGMFLATGQPQYIGAAASFAASSAAMGASAAKAGSVPRPMALAPSSTTSGGQDDLKETIKDALKDLGLDGNSVGNVTNEYFLLDPIAQDRRDVQARRIQEQARRARQLSITTEED